MVQHMFRLKPGAGEEEGAMGGSRWRKSRRRRGREAIMAIKKKMLQCSSAKEHQGRRFKRSYLAGGEQGDAAASAIFYLACLATCAPYPFTSVKTFTSTIQKKFILALDVTHHPSQKNDSDMGCNTS
uniref:Uncharacterized protein n=1 Tax=Oryza brachyantha TaxID=4533 RepID=J3MPZ9_ORYBR